MWLENFYVRFWIDVHWLPRVWYKRALSEYSMTRLFILYPPTLPRQHTTGSSHEVSNESIQIDGQTHSCMDECTCLLPFRWPRSSVLALFTRQPPPVAPEASSPKTRTKVLCVSVWKLTQVAPNDTDFQSQRCWDNFFRISSASELQIWNCSLAAASFVSCDHASHAAITELGFPNWRREVAQELRSLNSW